ncbi:DNA replication licensing factor Mcm7, partial [Kipferlia bialata]
ECTAEGVTGSLFFYPRGSLITSYRTVRLQEITAEVPTGHVPRSMTVRLFGTLARSLHPGDTVTVSGVLLPVPAEGLRRLRMGLAQDTNFVAMSCSKRKEDYGSTCLTPEEQETLEQMMARDDFQDILTNSIAPEIFGHRDLKRALLLAMTGSVPRVL